MIQDSQCITTSTRTVSSPATAAATAGVSVTPSAGRSVDDIPPGCTMPKAMEGGVTCTAWIVFFDDDVISIEV